NTRRRSASIATNWFTSGGPAATTNHTSSRSSGTNGRRAMLLTAASIASQTSGATTRSSAPARCSAATFDAATGPPPTISTRRPSSFKNVGKRAICPQCRVYRPERRVYRPGLQFLSWHGPVERPAHGVVIVGQFDGLVAARPAHASQRSFVVPDLEVGEFQTVRRREHHDAFVAADLAPRDELHQRGERHTGVRAIEHARPIRACGRVCQLRLARLLDDPVATLQRADRLL